jgi:uncharacterized repeat protein (TIGR01451 family)
MKTKLQLSVLLVCLISFFGNAQTQLTACDTNYNGVQSFNLDEVIPSLLSGQDPSQFEYAFFESQIDASTLSNSIVNTANYTNSSNPQLLWVWLLNIQTNEEAIATFSLIVNPLPILVTEVATACDENNDGFAIFDLTEVIQLTLAANNATPNTMSVTFYISQSDMQNQVNPISTIFQNQNPNQVIFIRIENLVTGCFWDGEFYLIVIDCTNGCAAPTNLTVSAISETGAILNWVSASQEAAHEIFVVPAGSPQPNASSQGISVSQNPYQLVGLTCATSYTFYVKTYCTNQTISEWSAGTTFSTVECGSTNTPFVTVNTNSFTTEQILNNVILNSSCGVISNVVTQGQCGVGYFNANQSDFPFEQGMIIRSGLAFFTEGSMNTGTSSSTCSQISDPDLVAIMQGVGENGSINDVTSVKFNIVPTENILSFNFLFASNEYGQFQCQFSDVFGFILTDLTTGQSQNIAVIPGTTTPISTTTIRNNLYNGSCPSVNSQFFSTFNINNAASSVNMAGYTVPMTAIATVIPNREYSLKLAVGDYQDSSFDSAVFIEGGSLALGNQCRNNIQIVAFLDANENGVKDANESNFVNGNLLYQVNNTGDTVAATASNGVFYIFPENDADTYDFNYEIYAELAGFYADPISFDDLVYLDTNENIYYIPIVNTTPYNDVAVSLVATNQPAAGFNYFNKIYYTNNGIGPASGTLTFEKDAVLPIASISVSGTVNNPTGFTYTYTNLMPAETRIINVTMNVPPIPTVAIDDLVTNMVTINSTTTDANIENNSASLTRPIVASYDPNDKNEAHGKNIEIGSFSSDDYLYYTIRFQNTGTTNATFVRLEDLLDAQLDPTSLRMVAASHAYTLERIDTQLVWNFDNIQLVPKLVNENASIGFVHFKIKLNAGFAVGDVIPNTAEIYFDFNPAIITNTFETVFVENLSTPDFMNSEVMLSPNPTKDRLNIQLKGSDSIEKIAIYDVVGKRIYTKEKIDLTTYSVEMTLFKTGIYFVEITTKSNQVIKKKIIKE